MIEHHHPIVLSMEQFFSEIANLIWINIYKAEIGEQYLIEQSNAWPNYASDYRPLVELAKHHQGPIIAANAPKNMVRCIGQQGIEYLDKLPKEQRHWVAKEINLSDSPYKAHFMAQCIMVKPAQHEQQFAAQMTWDETMAESIVDYLAAHPQQQVLHIAGAFHIQQGLGTAAAIHQRNPNLSIAIITPTSQLTEQSSDFQLLVLPMPIRYLQPAHQWQAIERLKNRPTQISVVIKISTN
ncbi:ChaN family lipoprotein [Vibrio metschnikovii]